MNGEHKVGDGAAIAGSRLMDEEEFLQRLRIGRRAFKEMQANGTVPPPLALGPRMLRWKFPEDFDLLLARLSRQEQRAEPPSLAQGRRARIEALKTPAQAAA